jgi:hypothetical protein
MRRLLLIAAAAGAVGWTTSAQVSLRGGAPAPAGEVARVDESGVWLAPRVGNGLGRPSVVVGWDRVRRIAGDGESDAIAYADVADALWRARTRLERGDFVAAEPLFERYFEEYRGKAGPTAAVVAEGLLRCRIRRAAHIAAVEPWLALLAARQSEQVTPWHRPEWASEAGLGSVIDPATGLSPSLPPIWLNWPSVGAWARSAPAVYEGERAAQLASLYLISAQHEAGIPAAVPSGPISDPGVRIVWEIVASRAGDEAQRSNARSRLRDRLRPPGQGADPTPAWLEAWCRAAIGRSLVLEQDPEQRRLGVIELLHVPARFSATHPYLAGIALAEASATLASLGDDAGAEVLRQELELLYAEHPVRDWRR